MSRIGTEMRFVERDGEKVLQQRRWGYVMVSPWWKVWRADIELVYSEWEDIPVVKQKEESNE